MIATITTASTSGPSVEAMLNCGLRRLARLSRQLERGRRGSALQPRRPVERDRAARCPDAGAGRARAGGRRRSGRGSRRPARRARSRCPGRVARSVVPSTSVPLAEPRSVTVPLPVGVELERAVAPRDRSVREHDRVARVAAERRAARGQRERAAGVEAGQDDELERHAASRRGGAPPAPARAWRPRAGRRRRRATTRARRARRSRPRGDPVAEHGVQELAQRRLRVAQRDVDLAVAFRLPENDVHRLRLPLDRLRP